MTLVMGHWKARGGSRVSPELERKSDLILFGDLPGVRLVSMRLN